MVECVALSPHSKRRLRVDCVCDGLASQTLALGGAPILGGAPSWEETLEGLVPRPSEKGRRDEEPRSFIPNSVTVKGGGHIESCLAVKRQHNKWKSFYNTAVAPGPHSGDPSVRGRLRAGSPVCV